VDSKNWVSSSRNTGDWRHAHISGDCRYWPVSSWMMHVFGPDYLVKHNDFCNQYQTRLDVHGLGITALEVICTLPLSARTSGAPAGEESEFCLRWGRLLDEWQKYRDTVEAWWTQIFRVFRDGGDFRPVHSWLLKVGAVDQAIALLSELRNSLRKCINVGSGPAHTKGPFSRLLSVIADLIDEKSTIELVDIPNLLGPEDVGKAQRKRTSSAEPRPLGQGLDAGSNSASTASTGEGDRLGVIGAARTSLAAWASAVVPEEAGVVNLATSAAAEGRRALESLAPIPAVAQPSCLEQKVEVVPVLTPAAEVAELQEAQAQLLTDLERLQQVKLRLQQAKKMLVESSPSVPDACGVPDVLLGANSDIASPWLEKPECTMQR